MVLAISCAARAASDLRFRAAPHL